MNRQILICAGSPQEGGRYAVRAELRPQDYRVVYSAKQVRGIQCADVHVLPSFTSSIQRHAIFDALRWGRDIAYFYVDPEDFPTQEEVRATRRARLQAEELGELDSNVLEAAYAEHETFDHAAWRREQAVRRIEAMTDEEIVAELGGLAQDDPAEAAIVAESVKSAVRSAAKKAAKPKPKTPNAAPTPADYFG